jgi:hypothetical protein
MRSKIASIIWKLSEAGYIPPLGRMAPIIFGWMINRKPTKFKEDGKDCN